VRRGVDAAGRVGGPQHAQLSGGRLGAPARERVPGGGTSASSARASASSPVPRSASRRPAGVRRTPSPPPRRLEQRRAELGLELGHLLRHGRRREVQPVGGAGEGAGA